MLRLLDKIGVLELLKDKSSCFNIKKENRLLHLHTYVVPSGSLETT